MKKAKILRPIAVLAALLSIHSASIGGSTGCPVCFVMSCEIVGDELILEGPGLSSIPVAAEWSITTSSEHWAVTLDPALLLEQPTFSVAVSADGAPTGSLEGGILSIDLGSGFDAVGVCK